MDSTVVSMVELGGLPRSVRCLSDRPLFDTTLVKLGNAPFAYCS
jgi:hypothetical protein